MSNTRKTLPLVAVAYGRCSTEDQRLGPQAQRSSIDQWAKRENVTVVAWHVDSGVSGGSEIDQRPALIAALDDLDAHRAGILVIARRDRLARDVGIAIAIERTVTRLGARIVAADGAGNGSGPADAFMRTVVDAAAAYERGLIRARTKAALAAKRARGFRAGEVPFGFTADAEGRLHACAREQRVIATVCTLRSTGLSLRGIANECNALGCLSRASRPLGITQVARILARHGGDLRKTGS